MLPTLGHCEDPVCLASSQKITRLFHCSIHCDRNLCLYHLNAHNVYYEEEKKQNDVVLCELQKSLNLYQAIFDQHVTTYRELVRQASTILLHNSSTLIPIEKIRPVLEKIQQATAAFQGEKVVIKCEPMLDIADAESEKENYSTEANQKVVLRIPRVNFVNRSILKDSGNPSDSDDNAMSSNENEFEHQTNSSHVEKRETRGRKRQSTSSSSTKLKRK